MRDMKDIKFKGWFESTKTMSIPFSMEDLMNGEADLLDGEKLLQYTGLIDKNGKEIYEGDIVRWGMGGLELSGVRYAVVNMFPSLEFFMLFYENEETGERKKPMLPFSFKYSNFIYTDTEKYLEVVGNIYENEELLK